MQYAQSGQLDVVGPVILENRCSSARTWQIDNERHLQLRRNIRENEQPVRQQNRLVDVGGNEYHGPRILLEEADDSRAIMVASEMVCGA